MTWFIIIVVIAMGLFAAVAVKMTIRALQYDALINDVQWLVLEYAQDLTRMHSGEILHDHPEIVTFAKRNRKMQEDLVSLIACFPNKPKPAEPRQRLPAPEVE